uniref:Uncharacterized protein n=1 Tax=Rhizophora mucronata TaxID=61149 RepID=A0A2P2N4A7_RHIMU
MSMRYFFFLLLVNSCAIIGNLLPKEDLVSQFAGFFFFQLSFDWQFGIFVKFLALQVYCITCCNSNRRLKGIYKVEQSPWLVCLLSGRCTFVFCDNIKLAKHRRPNIMPRLLTCLCAAAEVCDPQDFCL